MLSLKDLNENVVKSEYAVRGPIPNLAQELEKQGRKMWYFNIGNPQQLGQISLSYAREILALVNYPKLLDNPKSKDLFSSDSIKRAKFIMEKNPIGLGAYSLSAGMPFVKQAVADFITARDNIPTQADNIFLTDGASKGVDLVIQSLITNRKDGIMVPIPQYPLYSADITLFGGTQVNYYLDEEHNWNLSRDFLDDSFKQAQSQGIKVKLLVIINPNNPTGALLNEKNIEMVLEFANEHNLPVLADEVYQENIYDPQLKFTSFAKVITKKQLSVPLFSVHSTSKGFMGECGYRGGYIELRNIPDPIRDVVLKLRSIGLCANTNGQIMTYLMVKPPTIGDESYQTYSNEKNAILGALGRKAAKLAKGLNEIAGIQCPVPAGAMYLFPKLDLPKDKNYHGEEPDFSFCKQLVQDEGIVTVPGSGFGQLPNTSHLRMTILPPEDVIPEILEKFISCYQKFVSSQ